MLYWEDFKPGSAKTFGAYEVSEAEIVEFGQAYDPEPFHTDSAAAAASVYGSLIAPGLLVCSIFMRLLVDNILSNAASAGSPGVESVRYRQPVRPGDVLSVRYEVTESRALESRPDIGLVKNRFLILNQRNEVVAEIVSHGLFERRVQAHGPSAS